jgi:hypothetical protein
MRAAAAAFQAAMQQTMSDFQQAIRKLELAEQAVALYKDFFFSRLRFLFLFCFYFSPLIGDFFSYFFPITSKHESLWLVYNPF